MRSLQTFGKLQVLKKIFTPKCPHLTRYWKSQSRSAASFLVRKHQNCKFIMLRPGYEPETNTRLAIALAIRLPGLILDDLPTISITWCNLRKELRVLKYPIARCLFPHNPNLFQFNFETRVQLNSVATSLSSDVGSPYLKGESKLIDDKNVATITLAIFRGVFWMVGMKNSRDLSMTKSKFGWRNSLCSPLIPPQNKCVLYLLDIKNFRTRKVIDSPKKSKNMMVSLVFE